MLFARQAARLLGLALIGSLIGCAALNEAVRPDIDTNQQIINGAKADHSSDREGGIGGTGIFGSVTSLGSINVNGRRIQAPPALAMETPLGPRQFATVAPGDTVAVSAREEGDALVAETISLFLPVVGPITAISAEDRALDVMGTPILLAADTPIFDEATALPIRFETLAIFDQVAVSGIWRNDRVVATRLTVLAAPTLSSISGLVRERFSEQLIGSTPLIGVEASEEAFATAYGRFLDNAFIVARIDERPLGVFTQPVETLLVEGYLAPNTGDDGFHLSGFGIPLDPESPVERTVGARSVFVGSLDDNDFFIEVRQPLPNTSAERRKLLTP